MSKWLGRLRGALGIGATWAAIWGAAGAMLGLGIGMMAGVFDWGLAFPAALLFGRWGFFGGAVFSVALGLSAGRRRFDELSLLRFAMLGAVGGALVTAYLVAGGGEFSTLVKFMFGSLPLLGAASASGSLALPRKALEPDRLLTADPADPRGHAPQKPTSPRRSADS